MNLQKMLTIAQSWNYFNLGIISSIFTPQPLRGVRVLFSPMVSGWISGPAGGGKSLSGLYLRNCKV